MRFYNKITDGRKSLLIGGILIILLFGVIYYIADRRMKKFNSDFIWVEATITDIELNVPKGITTTKHIFRYEYIHNGKKYKKTGEVYRPELLKIGQKFKLKVSETDPELVDYELDGT